MLTHVGTNTIETKRLILRRFEYTDDDAMLKYWVADEKIQSLYSEPVYATKEEVKGLLDKLPQEETLLIYSSWDGYYKDPEQVKANPKYKEFRDMFHNVVDIHTSGHADRQTIEKVIKTVKPKEVICIHKEADAEL